MELVTTPGVINSLNYPNLYPNDYGHIWNITVAKGLKIEITFTALALEKCCDYVEVRLWRDTVAVTVNSKIVK